MQYNLTKYKPGSFREILYISLPLMMSLLSNTIMILTDRIILAHYSIDAVNAVATVINTISVFNCAFVATAAIAEVLVGQFNGKREYKKVSSPVWQMLWWSLFSYILYIPCAFWGGHLLIPDAVYDSAYPFYFWIMLSGPVFAAVAAISSFYIGIGKTYIVTIAAVVANLINIALDCVLIFGIDGYLDPMSSKGAGIATTIAQIVFLAILAGAFLTKENRKTYHTFNYKFDKKIFIACLKIGLPSTLNSFLLIGGWAVIANYIAAYHENLLTAYNFGLTFYLFFLFYTDALGKTTTTIVSNAIGANTLSVIPRMIKSATMLHLIILLIVFVCTWCFSAEIIILFYGAHNNFSTEDIHELTLILRSLSLLFFFEGYMGIYSGILLGGGDTRFILITNIIATWIVTVIPCIIWLKYFPCKVSDLNIYLFPFYCLLVFLMYFMRYKTSNWIRFKI